VARPGDVHKHGVDGLGHADHAHLAPAVAPTARGAGHGGGVGALGAHAWSHKSANTKTGPWPQQPAPLAVKIQQAFSHRRQRCRGGAGA
jgi:hypothetical protein